MVNLGPSTGCRKCRERHTKCDKTRPACRRCIIRGYDCPGYRDTCGVVFKDESRSVAEKQTRRARTKSPPSPAATLKLDPDTVVIPFFFHRHITAARHTHLTSRGHFDFLMPMFSSAEPSSALAVATLSTAARSMSAHFGLQMNAPWQVEKDLAASRAVIKAIADPEESLRDETLLAVLCLDFGTYFSQSGPTKSPSRAHLDGALALIRHRGSRNFENAVSRSLFAATRSNVLLQSLWYYDQRSQYALETFPDVDVSVDSPIMKLHYLLMKSLKLEKIPLVHNHRNEGEESHYCEGYHYKLARDLSTQLHAWLDVLPVDWRYLFDKIEGRGSLPSPALIENIPTLHVASLLGQWLCIKLTVLRHCFGAIQLESAPKDEESIAESEGLNVEAQAAAQSMCRLIGYLENVGDTTSVHKSDETGKDTARVIKLNVLVWMLKVFDRDGPGLDGLRIADYTMEYFQIEHDTMMDAAKGVCHYSKVASNIPIV